VIIAERLNRLAAGAVTVAAELTSDGIVIQPEDDIIDVEEQKEETSSNDA